MKIVWYWSDFRDVTVGISVQNNVRFVEIWFEIGVGTLVFAFDKS